ncbi:MAG: thioredoxin family protein [bacterium]
MVMAHKMAIECDLVRADGIEATEFFHLANRYNVRAIPMIVINETVQFSGAPTESEFLARIVEAAGS